MRFATKDDTKNWDASILSSPTGGSVFQSQEFARQKSASGWKARLIRTDSTAFTVLEKVIPMLGRFWYIPKGPGVTSWEQLCDLLPTLHDFAKQHGIFAVKLEPELLKTPETIEAFKNSGLVPVRSIQPNSSTVLIDLSPELNTVLTHLNQKGRHAIRRAERDGVTVQSIDPTDENCQVFYQLLKATAEGSFTIRAYDYYRDFWQTFHKANMGQLFFAYFEGQVVAGAYTLIFGTKSTYKDGASIRERTAYGASHLLQWHVITWAKERGSQLHDLCGAPPSSEINNPDHPHYGIGRFKTSFNKYITDYIGAYDLVVRPLRYWLWAKVGERIVLKLYFKKHHESWY